MTIREVHPASGTASNVYVDINQAGMQVPELIVKRDGRIVPFDIERIEQAMARCFASFGRVPQQPVSQLARHVVNIITARVNGSPPTVEGVQDIVEMVLQAAGEFEAAKRYILYRAERAKQREKRPIPADVRQAFADSDAYFPTPLQKFQFFDKYSRFNYDLGRRETWIETVDRAVAFLYELAGSRLPSETYARLRQAILEMRAMPSMRLLAMAGAAARRNHITIYNCSYQPVESIASFVEALTISMSGCGVGYSVEGRYVENFPRIKRQTGLLRDTFVVEDSAEGWADALHHGLETWFDGGDVRFDLSLLRPAGAPLRTKGGRASGPEPLRVMLDFARARILARQGSFLRPLDAHDMMCAVGSAAVSGGVRRTAMLALFDYDDDEMRLAKSGDFERENSQRWNANNSAVWPRGGLTQREFIHQFMEMVDSGRGEPGIFNREAANAMRPERRAEAAFGTNPCVTGETWVAVADGRGRVRMADLVAENRDVPVYTTKDGQLTIRTMRNPRKTGTQAPVYRVTFADGTSIRVTPNHTFILTDGSEKMAPDLQPDDALASLTVYSYQKKSLPQTRKVSYDSPGSYRMLQAGDYRKSEHRFIYQHFHGINLEGLEYHIHHRDFDGRNNTLDNLECLTASEHAQIHRNRMVGKNNPVHKMTDTWRRNLSIACTGLINGNARDVSNEELEEHIINLVRLRETVPTYAEYVVYAREHKLPLAFSRYRRDYFGGNVNHALRSIAQCVGAVPRPIADARKITDLPIVHREGRTYVVRTCEVCGEPFEVLLHQREQAVCSHSCSMTLRHQSLDREQFRQSLLDAHMQRRQDLRHRQARIYNDLMVELGRHPMKQEWHTRCKQAGVSAEMNRDSSPFRYWRDLQDYAAAANHRVIRVEPDGYADVYTGTVDETHTYFAIGAAQVDQSGRATMRYVLNRQCGEIILRNHQFCNLSAAVARQEDTFDSLRDKVEVATIIGTIQSMATYFPGLRDVWRQNCAEERLLGVDITGQMDCPAIQDAAVKARLKEIAIEVNRQTAAALGINPSAAITCVKPSGNCRPWYSLTSTSAGLLTLQELFGDHPEDAEWAEVRGEIYALQGDDRARIIRTYNNGISPTLRIRMNYGLTVESTPQHRWFVAYRHERGKGLQAVNAWVPAIELRPDDVLDVKIGAYTSETPAKLQRVNSLALKMRGNAQPIKQPAEMNEDLAWLLGYLWGDGSLSPGGFRIRFIDNRQENLLKAQRILCEQFGLEAHMYTASEKRRAWTLEIASVYLWHWLIKNDSFKYYADTINLIPQCVRASARNDIIAFIAGLLDSDGWSGLTHETRWGRFTLSTADRLFAQHIQDVSWAVGLPIGCSLNDAGDNLQNRREMYLLTGNVYVEAEPFSVLLRNSTKLQATATLSEFTRWEWEAGTKRYHIGKITGITPGEAIPTYDVEVEGNHWFYAGAVRSHNSSQLLNCSSGLHTRWAPYYIRNVRVATHSPLFHVLRSAGVPMDPENGQTPENANTWVIHFPVKSPAGTLTRGDRSAIQQCEYWLENKLYWTEHNPSVTITYRPHEVLELMKWVWEHRDQLGGITFLPAFDANYAQMPYVEISQAEYERLAAQFPPIDFAKIYRYEEEDLTSAAQELACSAGICETDF